MVKDVMAYYPQRGYLAAVAMAVVGLMLVAPVMASLSGDRIVTVSAPQLQPVRNR